MDLTHYFNKNAVNNNINTNNNNKFLDSINKLVKDKKLSLTDYDFLVRFIKKSNIREFNKFKEIVDKHQDLIILSKEIFYNFYNLDAELVKNFFNKNKNQSYNEDKFNKDIIGAINNIFNFLANPEEKTHVLCGSAGTGKTSLISKLVIFLIHNNFVSSIGIGATTNKAVGVIENKFIKYYNLLNIQNTNILEKIQFLTVHRLLGFKNDFNVDGSKIFVQNTKRSKLHLFDLVIIDESSMASLQIIYNIFQDLNKKNNKNTKNTKILFVGDYAQLPPVNEKVSIIFSKSNKDFDTLNLDTNFNNFIINQKWSVLTEIVRSNDQSIVGLCNEVREWVLGDLKEPNIKKYSSNQVKIYKNSGQKIKSKWFSTCLEYFSKNNNESNSIITWTNYQSNEYNDAIRKLLFKKDKLNKFEIGDILIIKDYYGDLENNKFFSSDQIKVLNIEEVIKPVPLFAMNLADKLHMIENYKLVEDKLQKTIKSINNKINRKYNVWKLFINKLSEMQDKNKQDLAVYEIYVIKDDAKHILEKDKQFVEKAIRELRSIYASCMKEKIELLENKVIKELWHLYNNIFVNPFAVCDIAYSISTHRSQGSSICNVFIDSSDILKNPNENEAKRCIYTALTRATTSIHLLI